MVCVECKVPNPDENKYCGQCGALVGHTLAETIRREDIRDRKTIETEITEVVFERLVKWSKWFFSVLWIILALFGVLLGWKYTDFRHSVNAAQDHVQQSVNVGEQKIQKSVDSAVQEIDKAGAQIPGIKRDLAQVQGDVQHYKLVNQQIEELQNKLTIVQGDVLDLRNRTLKVERLEVGENTPGPGVLSFRAGQCPSTLAQLKGAKKEDTLALCAQGQPPVFYEISGLAASHPISSRSPIGFQDTSVGTKPACSAGNRGTFYVEKGQGTVPDKPFLCMRQADGSYDWLQMSAVGVH